MKYRPPQAYRSPPDPHPPALDDYPADALKTKREACNRRWCTPGNLDSERYITSDPVKPWEWPVDPQGTDMSNLVEVAKLQAWTIKPAKLK